ncbi:MAG: transcription antitermination protein NusB [Akkermansia sp.]|nr:transcription antitermination protein NusB [Akkermansia sp.]
MSNISKTRQVALHLIYSVISNGGKAEELDMGLFWDITLEKETEHLRKALTKAILHSCRSIGDTTRLLNARAEQIENAMHGDLTTAPLRETVERYCKSAAALDSALAALRYSLKDKRREGSFQLQLCCNDVLRLAATLEGATETLEPMSMDFPAYNSVLAPFMAVVRRRSRMQKECAALAHPENLEGNAEYAAVVRAAREMEELKPAAREMAEKVLAAREKLLPLIEAQLQNYSMERLDVVDKCILLLALYELTINKLPVAIVVSEATALADTYSGSKSAPFIHGIIAAVAQNK